MRIVETIQNHRYLLLCILWMPLAWMLALPPIGLWPLGLVLYVPLMYLCRQKQRNLLLCVISGTISGLIAVFAVFRTFLFNQDEQVYAILLLVLFFLCFFVAHFLLVYTASRQQTVLARGMVFVLGLLATEYGVSRTGIAVPLFTGLLIIDTPIAAFLSRTVGYLGPSLVVLLGNFVIAELLLISPKKAIVFAGIVCMAVFVPLYPGHQYKRNGYRVGYVQQAVPNSIIRAAAHFTPLYWDIAEQYIRAIEKFDSSLDAIILPENAFLLRYDQHYDVYEKLRMLANRMQSDIITPAIMGGCDEGLYNCLLHIGANGELKNEYRKINLVPAFESTVFTAGLNSKLFQGTISIGPMLCYDSVFPRLYAEYRDAGADLVVVAAEAGFIRSKAVPWIHLSYGKLYAMTYGIPVLHVSQSGPSALITPDGNVTGITQIGEAGVVIVEL